MADGVLNVGVIGVGVQGVSHVEIFQFLDNTRVVAIADVNEKRARSVARRFGVRKVFSDFHEMLEQNEVEAVSVVLPDHLHLEAGVSAARAGKHILMEKPLATTVEDGRKIVDAVKKAGVRFMINLSGRWLPALQGCKKDFEAGKLGDPVYAYYRLNNTIYVPTGMLKSWSARTKLPFWLMSHTIDRVGWLWGTKVKSVYGLAKSGVLLKQGYRTPDVYQASITYENGAIGNFESCWILPNTMPYMVDGKIELIFSKAAVMIDTSSTGMEIATPKKYSHPRMTYTNVTGKPTGFVTEALRHFAESVLADKDPEPSAEDALHVLRATAAVVKSAETGRPVKL